MTTLDWIAALITFLIGGVVTCAYIMRRIEKALIDMAQDLDMISSAAQRIALDVGKLSEPLKTRKGKRFNRWLQLKWPAIAKELADLMLKMRSRRLYRHIDNPTAPGK